MKRLEISPGVFTLLDDEDYEWAERQSWHLKHPDALQHVHTTYVVRTGGSLHRDILEMSVGSRPGCVVDHIDRNGLNNQRANLRWATVRENRYNAKPNGKRKLGSLKGAHWREDRGKWRAWIKLPGQSTKKHLGYFATEQEAHEAWRRAAIQLHGEFFYEGEGSR